MSTSVSVLFGTCAPLVTLIAVSLPGAEHGAHRAEHRDEGAAVHEPPLPRHAREDRRPAEERGAEAGAEYEPENRAVTGGVDADVRL